MEGDNLVLVVGAYDEADAATQDFKALKDGQSAGEYQVVAAVVMHRDSARRVPHAISRRYAGCLWREDAHGQPRHVLAS